MYMETIPLVSKVGGPSFFSFFFNNEEWAELLSGSADYIIEGFKNQARVGPPGLRNLLGH